MLGGGADALPCGRGRKRSAGTFSNSRDADRAWLQTELLLAPGRLGGADTGELAFVRYVDDVWFPDHVLEPSTREGYRYSIDKHLMPTFAPMRMIDVLPSHVREWVADLSAAGVTPATIRQMLPVVLQALTLLIGQWLLRDLQADHGVPVHLVPPCAPSASCRTTSRRAVSWSTGPPSARRPGWPPARTQVRSVCCDRGTCPRSPARRRVARSGAGEVDLMPYLSASGTSVSHHVLTALSVYFMAWAWSQVD